ncbi:cystatin-9-like [Oryctolagus cuniculus]|uniref:cystatin-9-like n=1 Tax=Oryctolagus cuniculus TaxID=9986 RepID=UPI00048C9473|nr:cystatin-9-like [Oryctolagus cuniculus]
MSWRPGSWALPWALLPLLSFQFLSIHTWCSEEEREILSIQSKYPLFSAAVGFALEVFNQQMQDEYAYGLERTLQFWKEEKIFPTVFSMELRLHRTLCKKTEKDIENCPFQESPELSRTFKCFFTVNTPPWSLEFQLEKKICEEEFL